MHAGKRTCFHGCNRVEMEQRRLSQYLCGGAEKDEEMVVID